MREALTGRSSPGAGRSAGTTVSAMARRGRGLAAGVRRAARAASAAVFPRKCAACRRFWPDGAPDRDPSPSDRLAAVFQHEGRRFLCPACLASFEPAASPLCDVCGVMFQSRIGEDHRCGDCLAQPPAFGRARAAGVYGGALMAMIHRVKYRANLSLVAPLAQLLRETFVQHWPPGTVDVVLPIPLHPGRLRRRGFNQAQLLTRTWASAEPGTGCGGPNFPGSRGVFIRTKTTVPQTGLGKPARRRNIRGAFTVVDRGAVAGRRILLVDDVYTTGATADEAARALKRSGAETVDVLTVARTMPRFGGR